MSVWATVARKGFNDKFTANIDFPIRHYVTIADADIGSLESLRTLFDKYLYHMLVKFEQNCMVRIILHFAFFDQRWLAINFVDTILTFLYEQLFDAELLI